jgi:tripartite-type tricarboxylate transporter receptor subunit TctC
VQSRLSEALKAVLNQDDVRARFASQGFAATWTSPADTGQFIAREIDKWGKVVKASGATID